MPYRKGMGTPQEREEAIEAVLTEAGLAPKAGDMKERPISYQSDSVRAILKKIKSQTRRTTGLKEINECPDAWEWFGFDEIGRFSFRFKPGDRIVNIACPWGKVGDRLYGREAMYRDPHFGVIARFAADESPVLINQSDGHTLDWRWRKDTLAAMFMPREAARIFQMITAVKVQRLWDITEEEAKAEGIEPLYQTAPNTYGAGYIWDTKGYRRAYEKLWDFINGHRYPWKGNYWVFALTVREVKHDGT